MDQYLSLCLPYLLDNKCILFLGPRFARNEQGQVIFEVAQQQLEASPQFSKKLDYGFENLFIFKKNKPETVDKLLLNQKLKEIYSAARPHPLYDRLALMPFSAVISCSPDLMLKQNMEQKGIGVNYYFYSPKGNAGRRSIPDWPILFNVFGDVGVEDSLITTYADFFKFVISILGDEQQIPLDLKNAIASAKIFLFCGFDLTKWYIPLLVHKLHRYKEESGNSDLSAIVDHDNKREKNVERYYPVQMLWLDDQNIVSIDELYKEVEKAGRLRRPNTGNKGPVYEKTRTLIADNQLDLAIAHVLEAYRQKGRSENEITLMQSRKTRNDTAYATGQITRESYNVEQTNIENAVLAFADQADKF